MDLQILFSGFILIVLFYLIDSKIISSSRPGKEYIIRKLENNKVRDIAFLMEIEIIVTENDAWSLTAFPGEDITFKEYIEAIKEKYDIEYGPAEFEKLKVNNLCNDQIVDYMDKISNQDDTIRMYRADFDTQLSVLRLSKAS